jgi:hypothetical protein
MNSRGSSIRRCVNKNRRRKTMRKSLQFALAAGSMFIFTSAAMAQDATVRFSPLFQVQPQIAQEYAPYSVLPLMIWRTPVFPWRTPVFPQIWDVPAVVPFTLEETRAPGPAVNR